MFETLVVIAPYLVGMVSAVISGTILVLINRKFAKNDKQKAQELTECEEFEELRKRVWRLEKALVIMAKMIDNQTEKVHSELNANLEDITNELLNSKNTDN